MRNCNQKWFQQQFKFLRQQFLQDRSLSFSDVLSEDTIKQALIANHVGWVDRIYSPLVTLWRPIQKLIRGVTVTIATINRDQTLAFSSDIRRCT